MQTITIDAVDYMIERHFHQNQRYDYLIRFSTPLKEREILNISRIQGVQKAEPLLEIPAKIKFNGKDEDDSITGLNPETTLKRLRDHREQPVQVPGEGLLISRRTAEKLGVRVGDMVEVETLLGTGPTRHAAIKVIGINKQLVGGGSYLSLEQANLLLQERQLASGVMLTVQSPVDGVILSLPAEQEQVVTPGSVLASVAVPEKLEIKADILSDEMGEVSLGQRVKITAPVLGSKVLYGEVREIIVRDGNLDLKENTRVKLKAK